MLIDMNTEFQTLFSFLILVFLGFLWIKSFKMTLRIGWIFGFVEYYFKGWIKHYQMQIDYNNPSDKLSRKYENRKDFLEWVSNPIYACPFCMSSLHGIIVFSFTKLAGLHEFSWLSVLVYIPMLMGMITLYYGDPFDNNEEVTDE